MPEHGTTANVLSSMTGVRIDAQTSISNHHRGLIVPAPLVHLYIPVRNGANFIRDCIQSIIDQTYTNWILTVSDNQSSDQTESIVASFHDPRVVFYKQATDVGMIGNFNSCLDKCDSIYYAILSHDDKYHSNTALQEAVALLSANADIAVVYSNIVWIDGHGAKIVEFKLPRQGLVSSDLVARQSILSCRNFFGVPILLRRQVASHHRYDPRLELTADVDFSAAVGKGKLIYVIDKTLVAIRFHKTNNTLRDFSGIRDEMLLIAEKHGLKLSLRQRVAMTMNDRLTRIKKRLFFMYIDRKA